MRTTIARTGLARLAAPACIALAVLGVGSHLTSARPPVIVSPAPTTIATIDLVKLMQQLTKAAVLNNQLKARNDERQKSINEMVDRLKQMKEQIDLLAKDAEKERRDLFVKAYELEQTAAGRRDALQRVINIEKGELIRELYQDIQTAAAAFARKNGYDLVVVDDRAMTLPDQATEEQMNLVIQNKRVMFAAETLDVTAALAQEMNNQYQAPPASTPAPAPAPK